jgi:uncharacterized protein YjdB
MKKILICMLMVVLLSCPALADTSEYIEGKVFVVNSPMSGFGVAPVTGVSLDKTSISISVGGKEKITATVEPADATNKNVVWRSDNPAFATVDDDGFVTGINAGIAIITVITVEGSIPMSCFVTVTDISIVPVTGVKLNRTNTTLNVGSSDTLTATVEPLNATNKNVTWNSNNTAVATVTSNGLVNGVSAGIAIITATTVDGGFPGSCSVTVSGSGIVPVTGVSLDKTSVGINITGTNTLTATVKPDNATNKNVRWSSNNTAIATVTDSGIVTGVSAGIAIITVVTEDGHFPESCTVTVSNTFIPVTGIAFTSDRAVSIKVGGTVQLNAVIEPPNATVKDILWDSSNMTVATVTANGFVTGLTPGETKIVITAAENNLYSKDCTITVTEADPLPVDISWVNPQFTSNKDSAAGKTRNFEVDNLDIVDGRVTVKKSIAERVSKEIKSFMSVNAIPLPWFEAAVEPGGIAAVRIPVKGSQLYFETPHRILLLKILSPASGKFLEYVSEDVKYNDGRFTITENEDKEPIEYINKNKIYDLVVFIKDGGEFDLDRRVNGFVVDPLVLIRETWSGDDDDGGCSASYGSSISLLLIGLALFSIKRKR